MASSTELISNARLRLMLDMPFFGVLAYKLRTVIDNTIPTACTDGVVIRYNEAYVAKLSKPELVGLLVEEIGHCAFEHLFRMGNRDAERWNVACDQVLWAMIAQLAQNSPRVALSTDCVINPRFKDLSAEEIYHLLPPDSPRPSKASGEFSKPGENGEADSDAPAQELQADWRAAVQAAATSERMKDKGNLPAWMDQLIQAAMNPKVPWQEILREFASQAARDDFSTARPNRRYLHSGFVLPSLYSERLGSIIVAIDTSGSINMSILSDMLAELQSILDSGKPESITLIDCDCSIQQVREFFPGDSLSDFRVKGGGGTSFIPVFNHVDKSGSMPACLIYLTDMDGSFPSEPPYPCLWINYGHPSSIAPFGRTIHVS